MVVWLLSFAELVMIEMVDWEIVGLERKGPVEQEFRATCPCLPTCITPRLHCKVR